MVLRHLRYFLTVAEEGSIVRGAARLRVAQPALSRQLQALERSVGAPLFERDMRGVRLTPAGVALRDGVSDLFARLEHAIHRTRLANAGLLGNVRLALSRTAMDVRRFSPVVSALTTRYPDIVLTLREVRDGDQARALRDRTVDLAVGLDGDSDGAIAEEFLCEDVLDGAMLPAKHALAEHAELAASQLAGEPYLIPRYTAAYLPELKMLVARHQLSTNDVESYDTAIALVWAGLGWTLTSTTAPLAPAGIAVRRIRDVAVPVVLTLRRRADETSRIVANVTAVVRDVVGHGRTHRPSQALTPRHEGIPAAFELRQLEALLASLQESSLTRAAHRIGLTQAGISGRLRLLEQLLGCRLLERTTHGVVPTDAGRVLAREGGEVRALIERAFTRARRAARGIAGHCMIGCLPLEMTAGMLAEPLRSLARERPEIAVEVVEMLSGAQIRALLDGRIDVAIIGADVEDGDHPALASVLLVDDPIDCVLLASSHPLATKTWLRPQDLARDSFLFLSREIVGGVHDRILEALVAAGIVPVSIARCESPRILIRLVAEALGWTVATRMQRQHAPVDVVAIPLEGFRVPWGIRLAWRRDEAQPVVRHVLEALRTVGDAPVAGTSDR